VGECGSETICKRVETGNDGRWMNNGWEDDGLAEAKKPLLLPKLVELLIGDGDQPKSHS
jgi:hypothetical protein